MPYVTVKDGAQIFYKDWGPKGAQPILFSHGWPLSSDDWDKQMVFFGDKGYRVIAHDRRSHGRSTQTWDGNNMDQYADDLAELINALDLAKLGDDRPFHGRWRSRALSRPSRHEARVEGCAARRGAAFDAEDGRQSGRHADRSPSTAFAPARALIARNSTTT